MEWVQAGGGDPLRRIEVKRVVDLLLATLALIALSPLLLLIAVAIKIDSPGPVFFRQERVGAKLVRTASGARWERRVFRVFKFRSMVIDADESVHREHIRAYVEGRIELNQEQNSFKLARDPRITRVGSFLRRSSLDEVPQLINVVLGDMSLVGPRPVPLYEAEAYSSTQSRRLDALPGITGLWQVYGRGRVTFEEMIQMDLEYIENHSLWLDLKLLLMTVPAAIRGEGAG